MAAKKIVSLMLVWSMLVTPVQHAHANVVEEIVGGLQAAMAQGQQPQPGQQAQLLISQMNPRDCGGRPCTSTIFPECSILESRTNAVETPACTEIGGPNLQQSQPVQQAKLQEARDFFHHYSQVENLYTNFLIRANQPSPEGLTCLENQATALENRLKNRENEIDNLIARMQLAHDQFKHQVTQARLIEQVEDSQAIITGKPPGALERVTTQNNLQFSQPFQDPGCQSVYGSDKFNGFGRSGGLLNIEKEMTDVANKKDGQGRGSFNAMEFTGTVAAAVEQDIRRVASLQERQISSAANISDWLSGKPSGTGTSTYGLDGQNGPLSSIVEEQRQEAGIRNSELTTEIAGFTSDSNMSSSIRGNSDEAFNRAITVFETSQKNNCLTNNDNIKNLLSGAVSMVNRGSSKHANENAHNEYLNFIKQTLANQALTMEEKMARIQAEQNRGNTQYSMRLGGSLVVSNKDGSTRSIPPTESLSPAAFIGYIAQNCEQQFNENPNDQGVTGRQVVERARTARANFNKFRRGLGSAVSAAIINRSVNCADAVQANATGVGTCSASSLNASSGAFCVRRALSCANNMRNCLNTAKSEVQRMTTQRDGQVRTYKTALETHKQGMRAMYMTITNILSNESLQMQNSPLRHGLVLPTDAQLVPDFKATAGSFIKNLENLEMEDPDKYFQLTKDNLDKLKKALEAQRKKIMEGDKSSSLDTNLAEGVRGHIKQVKKNMEDAKGRAKVQAEKCEEAISRFTSAMRDQMRQQAQAQSEANAAMAEMCDTYNQMSVRPTCGLADSFDAASEAARRAGGGYRAAVLEFQEHCEGRRDRQTQDRYSAETIRSADALNEIVDACGGDNASKAGCQDIAAIEKLCPPTNGEWASSVNTTLFTPSSENPTETSAMRRLIERSKALCETGEAACPDYCGGANMTENQLRSRSCWSYIRGRLESDPTDAAICSDRNKRRIYAMVLNDSRTSPTGPTDREVWDQITAGLGEQNSACEGQNNEGGGIDDILNQFRDALNPSGAGTPSATGT